MFVCACVRCLLHFARLPTTFHSIWTYLGTQSGPQRTIEQQPGPSRTPCVSTASWCTWICRTTSSTRSAVRSWEKAWQPTMCSWDCTWVATAKPWIHAGSCRRQAPERATLQLHRATFSRGLLGRFPHITCRMPCADPRADASGNMFPTLTGLARGLAGSATSGGSIGLIGSFRAHIPSQGRFCCTRVSTTGNLSR